MKLKELVIATFEFESRFIEDILADLITKLCNTKTIHFYSFYPPPPGYDQAWETPIPDLVIEDNNDEISLQSINNIEKSRDH